MTTPHPVTVYTLTFNEARQIRAVLESVKWADEIIKKNDDPEKILAAKKKFCSFIIGGYNPRKNHNRVAFFQKLSKYKRVDSGGRRFNNIGGPIPGETRGKIEFLRQYKFNIAFENRSLAGYTTEKNLSQWWRDAFPFIGATRPSMSSSIYAAS